MRIFIIVVFIILALAGCTSTPVGKSQNQEKPPVNIVDGRWQVSPTFAMTAIDGEGKNITGNPDCGSFYSIQPPDDDTELDTEGFIVSDGRLAVESHWWKDWIR